MYPYVLSIAGFDPSGGAGIGADLKVFEQHHTFGLSVCTAITYQTEDQLEGIDWLSEEQIFRQVELLFKRYFIGVVKVGIIKDIYLLNRLLVFMVSFQSGLRVIWDPIWRTSTGMDIHAKPSKEVLVQIFEKITLLTPNWQEIQLLSGSVDALQGAKQISMYCPVLLKGGHHPTDRGVDYFIDKGRVYRNRPKQLSLWAKHGSGCVLSASIAAYLSWGISAYRACLYAKSYMESFLDSHSSLLGFHQQYARHKKNIAPIQLITQSVKDNQIQDIVALACQEGMKWVQYRVKDKDDDEIKTEALSIQKICKQYGTTYILNDRVELAKEIQADGVHLGKTDMSPFLARLILGHKAIIGCTAHTLEDIRRLSLAPIDYIGLGPFAYTRTKKNIETILGLKGYTSILDQCRLENIFIPIIGVGGIKKEHIKSILHTGIYGVSLSSAICCSKQVRQSTRHILDTYNTVKNT